MSIEEDCMEECDGCGNFMFECTCYEISEEELLPTKLQVCPKCNKLNFQCECENTMPKVGVIKTNIGGEVWYLSGMTSDGIPQFVLDIRGASYFYEDIATNMLTLCNRTHPYFFEVEES